MPFRYVRADSLEEVLDALSEHGDEAKVLAGGQSLGPLLNLRLATPAVLVDINRVPELGGAPRDEGVAVTVPAMTRQRDAERSAVLATRCPMVTQALPFVAHSTIRNRGTVGGSLAHADPAAELPTVATALDAEFTARSTRGVRVIPAADFFRSFFTSELAEDEVLVSVRFPARTSGEGTAWVEFAPRHGDFAIVGVAAKVGLDGSGVVTAARLVYSGVAETPYRATEAEEALVGQAPTPEAMVAAGAAAAAACRPPADLLGSSEYRQNLIQLLTARALQSAAESARRSE
ncbi:xanthine dehydrogenase family protein subunit M [Blastococcus sp. CT_GayMR20]|uniref:FAD binding domain-containing protein n=1 Tax=Blastococcus sp. CT_GayMR20 TaxID=2559609 RepID=UPI001ADD6587|nr:xanthine dehydrogenase family protein subunit M [Blastococcus sp. CT_GayMR20]